MPPISPTGISGYSTYPLESYLDLYDAYAKQQFDTDDAVTEAEKAAARPRLTKLARWLWK